MRQGPQRHLGGWSDGRRLWHTREAPTLPGRSRGAQLGPKLLPWLLFWCASGCMACKVFLQHHGYMIIVWLRCGHSQLLHRPTRTDGAPSTCHSGVNRQRKCAQGTHISPVTNNALLLLKPLQASRTQFTQSTQRSAPVSPALPTTPFVANHAPVSEYTIATHLLHLHYQCMLLYNLLAHILC
jgi:hypothetical protein